MRSQRTKGGFTLIELLVVVGIIIVATALALPGINQFLKGQKLTQAGRMIQGEFNEARRASITQRARHYVFVGRIQGTAGNPDTYALANYREGKGWDSTQLIRLPSSILFVFAASGSTPPTHDLANEDNYLNPLYYCNIRVQDWTNGLPSSNAPTVQVDATRNPATTIPFSSGLGDMTLQTSVAIYQFRKDGTIFPMNGASLPIPPPGRDIYDMNQVFDQIDPNTNADFILKQIGEPSRRCFVGVDINTGRVRFRVAETQAQDGTGNTSTR
jgi:prepilin-type N-terminal cleavage/methylation domain-containing protein